MSRSALFLWLVLSLTLTACYTVPETGRSAFIIPLFDEVKMGATSFNEMKAKEKVSTNVADIARVQRVEMKAKEKVSTNAADIARVQRVGKRLALAVGDRMPSAEWEFTVFDAPETINAFALPGGKVGVYSGLLRLAENDDELAFVMGHEIAHVTSRHGAQRATEMLGVAMGALLVDQASKNSSNKDAWRAAYGLSATLGSLGYSRFHESESDYIGLKYMAYAGYNPEFALSFWQKMAKASKGTKPPAFLSTHPNDESRIASMRAHLPEVLLIYRANSGAR